MMQFTVQAFAIAARGRQEVCEAIAMEQRDSRGWLEFPDATEPHSGFRDVDWAMALVLLGHDWTASRQAMTPVPRTGRRLKNAHRLD